MAADTAHCCSESTAVAGAIAEGKLCFHCLEPLPRFSTVYAEIEGREQAFCCYGCQSAASFIAADKLTEFYHRRQQSSAKSSAGSARRNPAGSDWSFLDNHDLNGDYVQTFENKQRRISLRVPGLYCSSCAWLINQALDRISSGIHADIDVETKRVVVMVEDSEVRLAEVVSTIERLGYRPSVTALHADREDDIAKLDYRIALKRILVAGLGMMQVMTYMLAVYLGEFQGIEADYHRFLTLVSMLVATVVVFYSGKPFFDNALNDIRHRRLGMDVPIALAIAGAYFPSVYITLAKTGDAIYFDSAVMFIFFLLLGRYVETRARYRLSGAPSDIQELLPPLIRVRREGEWLEINPTQVQPGDQVHLTVGQRVPFDGVVLSGLGTVDESNITGESVPVSRTGADRVLAGTELISGGIEVKASRSWQNSSIAKISELMNRARAAENTQTTVFDYLARYFVVFILIVTAATAFVWWSIAPERVLSIVLAMLVASCPCAFALAGPVGVAAAGNVLKAKGLLITNFKAIRALPNITTWCFDKTGTLTRGRPEIQEIYCTDGITQSMAMQLAASLEEGGSHVLSQVFTSRDSLLSVEERQYFPGKGVTASINGQCYALGKPDWIKQWCDGIDIELLKLDSCEQSSLVALADDRRVLALFEIADSLRPQTCSALGKLVQRGNKIVVLSGDRQSAVDAAISELPVQSALGDLLPEQKVEALNYCIQGRETVAMVGDGINDAPVIAHADVSLAMANGDELSQAQADVIILNGRLDSLNTLVDVAAKTNQITRQNLIWALAYNLVVLPLAAFGFLTPWLAALGMSLSSLLVVSNAIRIKSENTKQLQLDRAVI